jgi:hypothetical protein
MVLIPSRIASGVCPKSLIQNRLPVRKQKEEGALGQFERGDEQIAADERCLLAARYDVDTSYSFSHLRNDVRFQSEEDAVARVTG